jgi:hypothetical protein
MSKAYANGSFEPFFHFNPGWSWDVTPIPTPKLGIGTKVGKTRPLPFVEEWTPLAVEE